MKKWLQALLNLVKGEKAKCPHCGSGNIDYGYVILNKEKKSGYGAVWCNDCRHAFNLSRVVVKKKEEEKKVVSDLPKDIVFT